MDKNREVTQSLVTQFLTAVGDGDAEAAAAVFAENIDWQVAGNSALPWIGRRSNKADVADYLRTMWGEFGGAGSSVVHSLLIEGNEAVLFATITNSSAKTGRSFETPVAMHFGVSDGKLAKMHLYEDSWAVSRAFV